MKHLSGIILFSALLLTACSEDETVPLAGSYTSTVIRSGSIKMYTKNGEVKNKNSINAFINRLNLDYYSEAGSSENISGELLIEIPGDGTVSLTENGDTEVRNLIVKNQVLYFELQDTAMIFLGPGYNVLYSRICLYAPLYSDTSVVSSGTGFSEVVEIKPSYYARQQGEEIHIPILAFSHKYGDGVHSGGVSSAKMNNSFNKKALKLLQENDTLVVQEAYFSLRKQ